MTTRVRPIADICTRRQPRQLVGFIFLFWIAIVPVSGWVSGVSRFIQPLCSEPSASLLLAVSPQASPLQSSSATKEKLTSEAQELEAILEAKRSGHPTFERLVAQTAPAVRVAFSEEFGEPPGAFESSLLIASLKELGFDLVLDTNTAADLTVCEEGNELLQRILIREEQRQNAEAGVHVPETRKPLPLLTSCCPGWMNMIEKTAPELAPYVSTCKSPHMMYGSILKRYSSELLGCSPDQVYVTSVMPCIRKRGESDRPVFMIGGLREIDNVITTKDLGALLRRHDIDPRRLSHMQYDSPFQVELCDQGMSGAGTGAGQLFGATGGVMEAAVRSVYEVVTGCQLPRIELKEVRGLDCIKEATIPLRCKESNKGLDIDLRVAVISGLGCAKKLLAKMKDGEANYDFVEVMACPGGCIAGGGQPRSDKETLEKRLDCIYSIDRNLPIRQSHKNPVVKSLYDQHLGGQFGSPKAKEALHVKPVYGGHKECLDE